MWRIVVTSRRGSSHLVNGLPCQDSGNALTVGDVVICAMSDGAGSAKFSDEGSLLIVETALNFFAQHFTGNPEPEIILQELDRSDGERLLCEIRMKIQCEADKRGGSPGDFAGTLLVGLVHQSRSSFYQIGDGVWCVSRSGILGAATWPHQGEFVGQTEFVTSPSAAAAVQFASVPGKVDYVVGMTDGLERLALDMQAQIPHHGFCEPLIAKLNSVPSVSDLKNALNTFLDSERVCDRTDDDKSLALITYYDGV